MHNLLDPAILFFIFGALAAWQEIIVSPETGGLRIVELLVDVGARVKRGQLLVRLADDSLKTLYLCLLESVEHIPVGSAGLSRVRFQTGEMMDLLAADLTHADVLALKAGVSEADRCQRAREVLRYFGFEGGAR